jgi:hypothetical protein
VFAPRASQKAEPEGAFHEHGPLDVARRCEQLPVRKIATREIALEGGDKLRWPWGRVGARRVCDKGREVLPEELAAELVYCQ